jgi:hypothetical protein
MCCQNEVDEKRISDVLEYEKWREDGKDNHKKRDIANKLKKQNAVKKAKRLSKGG